MFVYEAVFISEQTAEYNFVVLLKISDKLNVFIYMTSQFTIFNFQFRNYHNHAVWFSKTQWIGNFAWKVIFCTTKLRAETIRNGKIHEDKA